MASIRLEELVTGPRKAGADPRLARMGGKTTNAFSSVSRRRSRKTVSRSQVNAQYRANRERGRKLPGLKRGGRSKSGGKSGGLPVLAPLKAPGKLHGRQQRDDDSAQQPPPQPSAADHAAESSDDDDAGFRSQQRRQAKAAVAEAVFDQQQAAAEGAEARLEGACRSPRAHCGCAVRGRPCMVTQLTPVRVVPQPRAATPSRTSLWRRWTWMGISAARAARAVRGARAAQPRGQARAGCSVCVNVLPQNPAHLLFETAGAENARVSHT